MAIFAIDNNQTINYSLKSDASDDKTIFVLKPLTIREKLNLALLSSNSGIDDGTEKSGTSKENMIDMIFSTLRYGLVGWSNFKMKDGDVIKDVPFETEEITLGNRKIKLLKYESIDKYLSDAILNELNEKILEITNLSREQTKN